MKRVREAQLSDLVSSRDHVQGRLDAPLQLVIYGDYECPYTRRALIQTGTVRKELGDEFAFVFRNFPLVAIHPHAMHAARAAESADQQGKFWEMHQLLFDHQRALTDRELREYARDLQLDEARFTKDLDSKAVASKIEADLRSGEANGVEGTPTLFVNGHLYRGSYESTPLIEALKSSLESEN